MTPRDHHRPWYPRDPMPLGPRLPDGNYGPQARVYGTHFQRAVRSPIYRRRNGARLTVGYTLTCGHPYFSWTISGRQPPSVPHSLTCYLCGAITRRAAHRIARQCAASERPAVMRALDLAAAAIASRPTTVEQERAWELLATALREAGVYNRDDRDNWNTVRAHA